MDTKVFKAKNNESGTFTQTLSVAEVGTAHVSPVPQHAPGVITAEIGTSKEEHIYYKSKDDGAGTISGLIRDYTNLNGGVGQEHVSTSAWETAQASEGPNNTVDAIQQGYHQEMNTIAYVGSTQFTVATDQTSFYTAGRILRFNQDNTKIGIVSASSYSSGTGLTTVTIDYGTVPASLTHVEMAISPKGATGLFATASAVQKNSYKYAIDSAESDAYVITVSPVPTAYVEGMTFIFKANTANTGAATLNVNSLGAKTIKKQYDQDLADNDIKAGQIVTVVYDGTNFQLQSVAREVEVMEIMVTDPGTDEATGDGKAFFRVPEKLNGRNLVGVVGSNAVAGTTGTNDTQLRRKRSGTDADMLSTKLTIDSTEIDSSTAATPPVIDNTKDDVQTGDLIFIDKDAVQTTKAKGFVIQLSFALP